MQQELQFISLGGVESVTRNMYLYQVGNEILIVDCGLGFVNDVPGVDFVLPDLSPLLTKLQEGNKLVGIAITHGHEDHLGALPFLLPQLPPVSIFATPITAGFISEKLRDFQLQPTVQVLTFNQEVKIGSFALTPIRVTHSVPDTAHFLIKTPAGNFYHGGDFKFDLTPYDDQPSDLMAIARAGSQGIIAMVGESLGADKDGFTPSEATLTEHFARIFHEVKGKILVTTYSSHMNRVEQFVDLALANKRKVAFVGRSLIKAKKIAQAQGRMKIPQSMEVPIDKIQKTRPEELLVFIAGSQGQEESALTRVVAGQHPMVRLQPDDAIVFSAEPIPGNETAVFGLVDSIAALNIKTYFSQSHTYHVSGHGSRSELLMLLQLVRPKFVIPVGGNIRHRRAYVSIATQYGLPETSVILPRNGQEVIFGDQTKFGKIYPLRNVYVDEIAKEEVEGYVLRDRQQLSEEGVLVAIMEISEQDGVLAGQPQLIVRGLLDQEKQMISGIVADVVNKIARNNQGDLSLIRRTVRKDLEREVRAKLNKNPLIIPVVIAV